MKKLMLSLLLFMGSVIQNNLMEKGMLMNTETYEGIQQFSVELSTEYGQLRLRWEKPEIIKGHEGYSIVVERLENGEWTRVHTLGNAYTFYDATDLNAYVCQEHGFADRQRFVIEAYDDDVLVGYAVSDEYDPREFFPEKEELIIDKDIMTDQIYYVSFTSNGTMAEDCYSYTAVKDDDGCIFYYGDSKEKKISDTQWNDIIKLVKQGKIVRKNVMDPEFVILDGGYRRYTVDWDDMSEAEDSYYVLKLENDDLLDYFTKLEKGGSSSVAVVGIGVAAAIGVASTLLLRKKK